MPRRLLAPPAAAILALGLAAPAAPAKQITQAIACGASGCRDVTARVAGHGDAAMETGGITAGPTRRAPFYRVTYRIGDGRGRDITRFTVLYVPSQHQVGSIDRSIGQRRWMRTTPAGERILHRAVHGLRPLPAARLPMPRAVPAGAPASPTAASSGQAERSSDGALDGWPGVALVLPVGGALALVARRRGHHDDTDSPPPGTGA
jgi:hypothetical protein